MATFAEIQQTYDVKGKIGEGGGGIVYLAFHKRLQKYVIFKEIKHPSHQDSRNRREADVLKAVRHEALPGVLDFLEIDGKYYTVMDYIHGTSLGEYVKEGKAISQKQLIEWAIVLCRALETLHGLKPPVIHCDIKPDNILISKNGKIYLIDFNISFYLNETGTLGYSRGFSAPEMSTVIDSNQRAELAARLITEKTDIYGLGSTLYYLIAQKTYDPKNPDWVIIEEKVSPALLAILKKSLETSPQDRFPSAKAFRSALENISEYDGRIHAVRHKRKLYSMLCVAGMAASFVLGGFSLYLMNEETIGKYDEVIHQQIRLTDSGQFDQAYALMGTAQSILKDDVQTIYQAARAMYQKGDYQKTAEMLNQMVYGKSQYLGQDNIENTYYLLADSLFQQRLYDQAVEVYQKLIQMDRPELHHYRDYAIATGYSGMIDQAQKILEDAIALGLSSENIEYVQAELLFLQDKQEEAITRLKNVLGGQDSQLNETGLRQILKWYSDLDKQSEALAYVNGNSHGVSVDDQPMILELKAQILIDLGNQSDNADYRKQAIEVFNQIIDKGWAGQSDYNAKSILYEKLGQLDQASSTLDEMESLFGTDYNVWKRRAFVELERQNLKAVNSRDYKTFQQYFNEAQNLYNRNLNDAEMNLLERTYDDVVSAGWL